MKFRRIKRLDFGVVYKFKTFNQPPTFSNENEKSYDIIARHFDQFHCLYLKKSITERIY